jgi:hypothetical protein
VGAGRQIGAGKPRAVGQRGQHGAAREVESQADGGAGVDAAGHGGAAHGVARAGQPVVGVLQGPACGQRLGDPHRVPRTPHDLAAGVGGGRAGDDLAPDVGHQCPHGQGPEVQSEVELGGSVIAAAYRTAGWLRSPVNWLTYTFHG